MTAGAARFAVFGFETTHDAVRAERVLLERGVSVRLIPTPRALGALCGLAARVPLGDAARTREALAEAAVCAWGEIEIEDRGGD
jgi:hypothetical protein